jgi:hypothetical protein
MKLNSKLRLRVETDFLETLKNQALQDGIPLSELCRQKLGACSKLTKIEMLLEELQKKLNTKLNSNRR